MIESDLLRALERRVAALESELREHQEAASSESSIALQDLKKQMAEFKKKLETTEHLSWLGEWEFWFSNFSIMFGRFSEIVYEAGIKCLPRRSSLAFSVNYCKLFFFLSLFLSIVCKWDVHVETEWRIYERINTLPARIRVSASNKYLLLLSRAYPPRVLFISCFIDVRQNQAEPWNYLPVRQLVASRQLLSTRIFQQPTFPNTKCRSLSRSNMTKTNYFLQHSTKLNSIKIF